MNRKARRLLRYFQKNPTIRIETIKLLASVPFEVAQELSLDEQIAVFTLWCVDRPIDQVIERLYCFALDRSIGKPDSRFYSVLEREVEGLEREGLDQNADDLLKIGAVLAEMHQDWEKAGEYRRRIQQKLEKRIRDLEFLKQRGW